MSMFIPCAVSRTPRGFRPALSFLCTSSTASAPSTTVPASPSPPPPPPFSHNVDVDVRPLLPSLLGQACLGILRLDNSVDCHYIEDIPLARYPAQYWANHAHSVSSRIGDGMKCLFDKDRPHFATLFSIYNEDCQRHSMSTNALRHLMQAPYIPLQRPDFTSKC